MPTAKLKEELELDTEGLSEEEIAALQDESEAEEAGEEVVDKSEEPEDKAQTKVKDEKEDEHDATEEAVEEEAEDSGEASEDEADEDEEIVAQNLFDDQFTAQLKSRDVPEDIDEQVVALQDSIQALDEKLDAGDMDYAEHSKESRRLVLELSELSSLKREAQLVAENNQKISNDRWDWEVARFMEENEAFKNPVVSGALNAALNELYASEDNNGRSYRWFLKTASDQVFEVMNLSKAPAQDADAGDGGGKPAPDLSKVAQMAPKMKKEPPPKTLGGVPEADRTVESADEFSHLDNLSGIELEQALAGLSPEKEKKYLDTRNL